MFPSKRLPLFLFSLVLAWQGFTLAAQAVDVYIVYSGRDRALRNEVTSSLPNGVSVKSYNADLLALADYSGKQKAVGKISRATVVIIVGSRPLQILKKTKVKSNLLIVGNSSSSIKASRSLIYIVAQGTNLNGANGKKVTIKTRADVSKATSAKFAMVAKESSLSVTLVAALIAHAIAG